ncbi:MAG TPA: hypothetical protein VFR75_10970, partial [Solirubrobacterales bacterium]|nr:hypothetical protein [Solirubrobacterales bacterium]
MKRLRHPIRAIREPFGTAGLVVAVVALVAALAGGAYAASGGLNAKQKKEVKKIAKSFQGTGPAGAQGPAGPAGPAGANGKDGANGAAGTDGADGISPVGTKFFGNANGCEEGGVKFVGVNTTFVCNGLAGEGGEGGGFPETLPPEASMTGTWTVMRDALVNLKVTNVPETSEIEKVEQVYNNSNFYEPISFPIPLSGEVTPVFVGSSEAEKEQGESEGCPGLDGNKKPLATAGKLCVYMTMQVQGIFGEWQF